ncbi:MAG TPA: rhodanese-like domain-containing protein [Propionibacterium sp.]|nr:rhodanese-like domain-containing protein [Propionibacterium sp.]
MFSRRAALALLGLGLVGCAAPAQPASGAAGGYGQTLDAAGFAELVARPGVVVLDVRTPAEFAAGHLPDAVNIDVQAADFAERIGTLDPQATHAVYCRSGNRSQVALDTLRQAGFVDAHHLGGGIGAWQAAGGDVVR